MYPHLEPSQAEWLDVGEGHRVYYEISGNPAGFPVLFIHGGPGSRTRPAHRRFFDPGFYRIVLFDQRGCGRSAPLGATQANTTPHLLADIELLRRTLGVDRWLLFGGSWGAALCLAYAIAHPERVAGMVLRGVFLASDAEIAAYLSVLPHAWTDVAGLSIIEHYRTLVENSDPEVALAAARRWWDYEARVVALAEPGSAGAPPPPEELLASARVQLHFLAHQCFLRPNELLDQLPLLGAPPVIIVQGALDRVCPPAAAQAVAERLSGAELRSVAGGGHSALQPAMAEELCAATARMRDRVTSGAKNSARGP
jgi:proline iminopeptidase